MATFRWHGTPRRGKMLRIGVVVVLVLLSVPAVLFALQVRGVRADTQGVSSISSTASSTETSTAAGMASLSTTALAFGDQQVGTTGPQQSVTLTNTGTGPLTITGAALSGPNPSDFVVSAGDCTSPTYSVVLQPGTSCTMAISFQPTAIGARSGTLTISCDASNCPLSGPVTGNGIDPSGSVSPSTVAFSDTYLGSSSAAQTVTVSNAGTTNLVISALALSGPNPGDFSFSAPAPPITVAPGGSTSVSVTFTPTASGPRSATLALTTNDSQHPLSVALSGVGLLTADLALTASGSPSSLRSGSKLTYTIVVQNNGAGSSAGLVMSDPLPAGTFYSSVATTLGQCGAPAVGGTGTVSCFTNNLPAGASVTVTLVVTVRAANGSTITNTATVSANTQDPNPTNNSATITTSVSKHPN